ncbi:MAG: alkaline phosphatase family protein, partial [Phycisphaerae bacterium]
MKKTIVIGFDGATPQLIKKWSQQGKLPNFSKILSDGVYGDLETTIPPLTPCAWSSFMTGKNPGKHGIYDFFYLDKQHEIKINTSNSRSAKDIWEILSENDFKCFVFNVPFTYPPKKIKGLMVTDFTTPSTDSEFTYPVSLRETILKKYTGFAFSEKSKYAENYKARRDFRNDVFNLADLRFKIANDLIKENECDFYMVTFMIADHIQHWYWKFMDREHPDYIKDDNFEKTIENAYIKLDSFLGELMKTFSGHNIFIMSDHGSGPYYQDVTLNNWLMDQGYLCMKKNQSAFKNVLGRIGVNKLITFGLNIG